MNTVGAVARGQGPIPNTEAPHLPPRGSSGVSRPKDLVNHPPHYQGHPKGIECIDVIEDMPYPNLANVVKYAWRVAFGGKWDDIEDLKKIVWYANREISRRNSDEGTR